MGSPKLRGEIGHLMQPVRPATANHPELQRAVHGIVARKPQDGTITCKHEGTGIGDVERTVKTTLLLVTGDCSVSHGVPGRAFAR